jgi:hypothetical protein
MKSRLKGPSSKVCLLYYLFTLRNVPVWLMFILLNNLVLVKSIKVTANFIREKNALDS